MARDLIELLIKQILPPAVIRASHQSHDVTAGMEIEGMRLTHQLHTGFGGHLISLAAVAGMATRDQVFPTRGPASRARHYMVQRQLTRRQKFSAILAGIPVAQQNVLSR
ncbi:MAG: hypothetical protein JWN74_240 [Acidobacteriaceae bacterium]|nr:hypothetical protein [Acidobacteriaceae bacterium]